MGRNRRKSCYDVTADHKDSKQFDEWFYSRTLKDQDIMRASGVLPYKEMKSQQYVFDVQENNKNWGTFDNDILNTKDEFISTDHVRYMLSVFLNALIMTDNFEVRRHVELIKWALDMPNKLSSREMAKMYDVSHSSIQKMANELRANLNLNGSMSNNQNVDNAE